MSNEPKAEPQAKSAHTPFSTNDTSVIASNGLTVLEVQDYFEGFGTTISTRLQTRRYVAHLSAEAFNVSQETGLTPRQLAEQRAELLAMLRLAEIVWIHAFKQGLVTEAGIQSIRAVIAKTEGRA